MNEHSNTPFFSVVIPTKNRPFYLDQAIRSVLHQDFSDFELIISDNFNESDTHQVIAKYRGDRRVKVFRTDREMNMPDHWEFATLQATGKYVLLLADRKLLYQGALRKLQKSILTFPGIPVFSFHVRSYNDLDNKHGWEAPAIKTTQFSSLEILSVFLKSNYLFGSGNTDYYIPKTLNGIFSNAFASRVREQFGNYFNNPGITTPDYSSFFVNLSQADRFVHFGFPVLLTQGEHISNGRIFGSGIFAPYLTTLDTNRILKKVPLDIPLIFNLLTNDYLEIREKFCGNLIQTEPDWFNYYHSLYLDLFLKSQNSEFDTNLLDLYMKKWEDTLSRMPEPFQRKVRLSVEDPARQIQDQIGKIDGGLKMHFRDFINHRFSRNKFVNRIMKYRFRSALEAAGFQPELMND